MAGAAQPLRDPKKIPEPGPPQPHLRGEGGGRGGRRPKGNGNRFQANRVITGPGLQGRRFSCDYCGQEDHGVVRCSFTSGVGLNERTHKTFVDKQLCFRCGRSAKDAHHCDGTYVTKSKDGTKVTKTSDCDKCSNLASQQKNLPFDKINCRWCFCAMRQAKKKREESAASGSAAPPVTRTNTVSFAGMTQTDNSTFTGQVAVVGGDLCNDQLIGSSLVQIEEVILLTCNNSECRILLLYDNGASSSAVCSNCKFLCSEEDKVQMNYSIKTITGQGFP